VKKFILKSYTIYIYKSTTSLRQHKYFF